jgi:hypothetical protein
MSRGAVLDETVIRSGGRAHQLLTRNGALREYLLAAKRPQDG